MFEAYLRWRHTRGFGVHSPFAYRVLTEVITCPHGYYGFHSINRGLTPAQRRSRPAVRARMLLRLAVFLRPATVALPASGSALWRVAVKEGYRKARIVTPDAATPALLVAEGDAYRAAAERTLAAGGAVLLFGISVEESRSLAAMMAEGIGFIAPDALLLIPRRQTARAVYTVNF